MIDLSTWKKVWALLDKRELRNSWNVLGVSLTEIYGSRLIADNSKIFLHPYNIAYVNIPLNSKEWVIDALLLFLGLKSFYIFPVCLVWKNVSEGGL